MRGDTAQPLPGRTSYLAALSVSILLIAVAAYGQHYTIDQSNDYFDPNLYWGILANSPIGQEFTPTLDRVDFVELWILITNAQTELELLIRVDTIDGPSLGSCVAAVGPYHDDPLRFAFDQPLPLIPGNRYVIQVIDLGAFGRALMGVEFYNSNQYPGGRVIFRGDPNEEVDAWFREGIWGVSAVEVSTWGSIKALYREH